MTVLKIAAGKPISFAFPSSDVIKLFFHSSLTRPQSKLERLPIAGFFKLVKRFYSF